MISRLAPPKPWKTSLIRTDFNCFSNRGSTNPEQIRHHRELPQNSRFPSYAGWTFRQIPLYIMTKPNFATAPTSLYKIWVLLSMKIYPPFSRAIGKTTLIALALFAAYAAFLLINGRSLSQNRWLKVNVSVQYLDDGMKLVLRCVNSSEYAPAAYVICKSHETRRSTTTPSFRGIHI